MRILLILLLSERVSQVWGGSQTETEDSPFSELNSRLPPDDMSGGENSDKTETDAGEETSGSSPSPPTNTTQHPSPPAITSSLPQTIYLLSGLKYQN